MGNFMLLFEGKGRREFEVRDELENRGMKNGRAAVSTVDTPSSSINPVPLLPSSSTTPQSPPSSSSSHVPQTQNLS
jgi:hypothetical protein